MPLQPSVSDGPGEVRGRFGPRARLAVCAAVAAVIWLAALPRAAQVSSVRAAIERNELNGVDPSAKFYSEIPAMPMISRRVDQIRSQNRAAFWGSE